MRQWVDDYCTRFARRMTRVVYLCGWCGCTLRNSTDEPWNGNTIEWSHGICDACLEKRYPQEELEE